MLECENEIKGIVKKVVKVDFAPFFSPKFKRSVLQRIRRAPNSIKVEEASQTATEKIKRATSEER